jgi:hypothetical protein
VSNYTRSLLNATANTKGFNMTKKLAADNAIIRRIAERAVAMYERYGIKIRLEFITMELRFVHEEIVPLRLSALLMADDADFAHDIGGIHQHLVIGRESRLTDYFVPRFAA